NTTSNRPQQCDYLKEYNLQANDWRQQEGDNYVCISDIISTDGSDDIDANGLDYQVEGTQNGVSLMTVRVLLNRSQQATEAKTKFIEIAKELIKKQTGTEAP